MALKRLSWFDFIIDEHLNAAKEKYLALDRIFGINGK